MAQKNRTSHRARSRSSSKSAAQLVGLSAEAMQRMAPLESYRQMTAGGGGKWAGAQLLAAVNSGKKITTNVLRTLATLRKDEWVAFDNVLMEEAALRLRAVQDLFTRGLVKPIANGLGKTMLEYETVGEMTEAIMSMTGLVRSDNDRVEFDSNQVPLPITHKDFFLDLRHLEASREKGESLDTLQARLAGRAVSEKIEYTLINGGGNKQYRGKPIYGYLTHPDVNLETWTGGGNWEQTAKTGAQFLADVMLMKSAANADRFYGPFVIYYSGQGAAATNLDKDYSSNFQGTIRQRLLQVEGISAITALDFLPVGYVVMVQMTPDVVQIVEGEPLQTIQWDIEGGFGINFKAFAILVPLIRSDPGGRSGIVVLRTP